MNSSLKNYINGAWVSSSTGTRHAVINPATEEACAEVVLSDAEDVNLAVTSAKNAFDTYSLTSKEERLAILQRIAGEYQKRIPDLATSMAVEMGAPISLGNSAQAPAGLGGLLGTISALESFQFTDTIGTSQIKYEAMGVVGMITPWNWPLNQIMLKLAPALAAGNTVVLKPSEECPGNATILAEIIDAANVPAGIFNLVHGDGATVGSTIASHPDIEMVSFTGSTRAGTLVAQAAATTVKRVHQELGGNAPNIVLPASDLASCLPQTVSGCLINSGQSCTAPSRLLVHKDQEQAVIDFVRQIFAETKSGSPVSEGMHIGPVVNRSQYEKIQTLIKSAIDEGAKLEIGGLGRPDDQTRGFYVQPTVFSGVTTTMRIYKEEIFGPVITITPYSTINEAVQMANDTQYGLSSVITGDPQVAATIAPRLRAGMVAINNWIPTAGAPFGGYKQSGNGKEGGLWGLRDFMELKAISGLPH